MGNAGCLGNAPHQPWGKPGRLGKSIGVLRGRSSRSLARGAAPEACEPSRTVPRQPALERESRWFHRRSFRLVAGCRAPVFLPGFVPALLRDRRWHFARLPRPSAPLSGSSCSRRQSPAPARRVLPRHRGSRRRRPPGPDHFPRQRPPWTRPIGSSRCGSRATMPPRCRSCRSSWPGQARSSILKRSRRMSVRCTGRASSSMCCRSMSGWRKVLSWSSRSWSGRCCATW